MDDEINAKLEFGETISLIFKFGTDEEIEEALLDAVDALSDHLHDIRVRLAGAGGTQEFYVSDAVGCLVEEKTKEQNADDN